MIFSENRCPPSGRARGQAFSGSYSSLVEARLAAGAVEPQRALFADRIRPLEDPILPGGQPRKDLRFHCLWTAEAKVGLQAGEAVGGETRALLQKQADLILPIDVVESKRHKTELFRPLRVELLPDRLVSVLPCRLVVEEPCGEPGEAIAHRDAIVREVDVSERDRRRRPIITVVLADEHVRAIGREYEFSQCSGKA